MKSKLVRRNVIFFKFFIYINWNLKRKLEKFFIFVGFLWERNVDIFQSRTSSASRIDCKLKHSFYFLSVNCV